MTEIKIVATIDMIDMILVELPNLPSNDMEDYIREEIITFNKNQHTPTEKYDFIVEISKKPCKKIGDKICVGEISSFTQQVCALDKHYKRP